MREAGTSADEYARLKSGLRRQLGGGFVGPTTRSRLKAGHSLGRGRTWPQGLASEGLEASLGATWVSGGGGRSRQA